MSLGEDPPGGRELVQGWGGKGSYALRRIRPADQTELEKTIAQCADERYRQSATGKRDL